MILSHKQIEEIAVAVTKDFNEFFLGKDADNERLTAQATPIDQFAKDYLGLSVSFAHLLGGEKTADLWACRGIDALCRGDVAQRRLCEALSGGGNGQSHSPAAPLCIRSGCPI